MTLIPSERPVKTGREWNQRPLSLCDTRTVREVINQIKQQQDVLYVGRLAQLFAIRQSSVWAPAQSPADVLLNMWRPMFEFWCIKRKTSVWREQQLWCNTCAVCFNKSEWSLKRYYSFDLQRHKCIRNTADFILNQNIKKHLTNLPVCHFSSSILTFSSRSFCLWLWFYSIWDDFSGAVIFWTSIDVFLNNVYNNPFYREMHSNSMNNICCLHP